MTSDSGADQQTLYNVMAPDRQYQRHCDRSCDSEPGSGCTCTSGLHRNDVTEVGHTISVDDSSYLIINRTADVAIEVGGDGSDDRSLCDSALLQPECHSSNNDDDVVLAALSAVTSPHERCVSVVGRVVSDTSRDSSVDHTNIDDTSFDDTGVDDGCLASTSRNDSFDDASLVSVRQLSSNNSYEQERDDELETWLAENNIRHGYGAGDVSSSSDEEGINGWCAAICTRSAGS